MYTASVIIIFKIQTFSSSPKLSSGMFASCHRRSDCCSYNFMLGLTYKCHSARKLLIQVSLVSARHWKFVHAVVCVSNSFLLLSSIPLSGYTTSVYSPGGRHLGCFQFLSNRGKAAIIMHIQVFEWKSAFISWVAGLYGMCMVNCHKLQACSPRWLFRISTNDVWELQLVHISPAVGFVTFMTSRSHSS